MIALSFKIQGSGLTDPKNVTHGWESVFKCRNTAIALRRSECLFVPKDELTPRHHDLEVF